MLRKSLLIIALLAMLSLIASAQELTAREYAKAQGIHNRQTPVRLSTQHACTLSHRHPCIYYGGDGNENDPISDALSNENTLFIPQSYTYTEVNSPGVHVSAAFSNNLSQFGVLDPKTATWQYRVGVSEGNGGTVIGSGNSAATIHDNHRYNFAVPEFEVLTTTPLMLPKGLVWFSVTPNCTNPGDDYCLNNRFFETSTDGLNAINGGFSVKSQPGIFSGAVFDSEPFFGYVFADWCNDLDAACGETMSAGLLK